MTKKTKKRRVLKKAKRKPKPKPQVTETTRHVTHRLPHEAIELLERYTAKLEADLKVPVSRSVALARILLEVLPGKLDDDGEKGGSRVS